MPLEKLGNSELGVVIDTGSHAIKYGVTGSDHPQGVFPKNDSAESGAAPLVPEWPVERGTVIDWEALEKVWSYGFVRSGFKGYDQHIPVGIVTAMDNLRGDKKDLARMAELLFETFEVGQVRFDAQPMAGLYASGRTTGVGVCVGHGLTQVLPVFNGIPLCKHFTDCARQTELGAADVDGFLLARHESLGMMDRFELSRIKAEICAVPQFINKRSQYLDAHDAKNVMLPDGSLMEVGPAAWLGHELLCDPSIAGALRVDRKWQQICGGGGVPAIVASCIGQVPAYHSGDYSCGDWRVQMSNCMAIKYNHRGQAGEAQVVRELARNICVFGGPTMTTGFVDRISQQMRSEGPPGLDINISAAADRSVQEWIGSSIFMSLSSVTGVTRASYQEHGPNVVCDSFSLDDNMLLQEDYELIPPQVPLFASAALTIDGGSPLKAIPSAGKAVEFNSQDLASAEQAIMFKHPSPMWTALKFVGQKEEPPRRCVIKVGPVMRQRAGSDQMTPMALVDDEDGAAHLFQRAPALQVLHDQLVAAGIEVIYRNEPGVDAAYKILFLDGTGFQFAQGNSLSFQGIKEVFGRFGSLHGSLPGAPSLEVMYENSNHLTEAQLRSFEMIDKDPREFVPVTYFESLSAFSEAWAACKAHYKIQAS